MALTAGSPEIGVGLIDGPVMTDHPALEGRTIRETPGRRAGCASSETACAHGTAVAGILVGDGRGAPGICRDSTLVVRPIFDDARAQEPGLPTATPDELAAALRDCIEAGARVVNISAALLQAFRGRAARLSDALEEAGRRGILVVAAAGNQATVGSSPITGHPSVIPVAACDLHGRALDFTNLGNGIGKRGLLAPGDGVASIGPSDKPVMVGGTSAAAPFVTGTIALLWSLFPRASPVDMRRAVVDGPGQRRSTIVPPVLNASNAYDFLRTKRSLGDG